MASKKKIAEKPKSKVSPNKPATSSANVPRPSKPATTATDDAVAPANQGAVIEHGVALERLHVDPANARRHPERNMQTIMASLRAHQQVEPLIVQRSSGRIIGGNGRYEAMRLLGWTACTVAWVDISDVQATALGITLNRSAEQAEWDLDVLDRLTVSLEEAGVDLADIGFTGDELDGLLETGDEDRGSIGEEEEDDVPDPPVEPVTSPGDVWVMGQHRLLCGDSQDPKCLERLGIAQADAVLTDPPYGVSYVGKTKASKTIQNDGNDGLESLLRGALGLALQATRPGAAWYVASPANPNMGIFARVLTDMGVWRQTLVWVKDVFVLGHGDYHYRHEPIFYGWSPGGSRTEPADRKQDSVWEFARPRRSEEHPTMKPLALYGNMLTNSTRPGDLVYEPFSGSGTTLLACEKMGRRCYAIEIDPAYVDVAVARWEELTGNKAELQTAGPTPPSP